MHDNSKEEPIAQSREDSDTPCGDVVITCTAAAGGSLEPYRPAVCDRHGLSAFGDAAQGEPALAGINKLRAEDRGAFTALVHKVRNKHHRIGLTNLELLGVDGAGLLDANWRVTPEARRFVRLGLDTFGSYEALIAWFEWHIQLPPRAADAC